MKLNIILTVLFLSCLSATAFGQQAKLEGRVLDDKDRPVSGIRIVASGGQATVTDSKGHFRIGFPTSTQPGQATRIEVIKSNWVIFQPMFGYCVTQSTQRNYEPLRVIIVPKGSPLALSPKRLSQVIAQWAAEKAKLRAEVGSLKHDLDEYDFLRQYTKEYGFSLDQFRNAAEQWAKIRVSDDKEEQALKEYWQKHYASSAQLAQESAQAADEELKQANKKTTEASLKVVRRYKLSGNAHYAHYKFREALDAYSEIDKRFVTRALLKDNLPAEWAETKLLLGNAKEALGERVEGEEGPKFLKGALAEYQHSGSFYTRDQLPEQWAETQNNLGIVLSRLGVRVGGAESIQYLNDAVVAFRGALEVRTRQRLAPQWAITQNNLCYALASLGIRVDAAPGVEYLNNAVAACRSALEVNTRPQLPQKWAATQNNLAIALSSLGARVSGPEGIKFLREAIAADRAALELQADDPRDWAITQNNLGSHLRTLAERVTGPESIKYLNEAVSACRAALTVLTREQLPQDWAIAQNTLGNVLWTLGLREDGTERVEYLKQAAVAYRAALEVKTLQHAPQQWALLQNDLGTVLSSLGAQTTGPESVKYLNEAVEAHRDSLKVFTREQVPQFWAMAQFNLGIALSSLGERVSSPENKRHFTDAVTAYRAALEVKTRDYLPQDWAATQNALARTYFFLNDLSNAAAAFASVLTVDPDNNGAYGGAAYLYHDVIFRFHEAFLLHQQWLARHPDDPSAQANFAEALFSIGRFSECTQRINALLVRPELSSSSRTALRAIEIASLLADEKAGQVPDKIKELIIDVTRQPPEFKVTWNFDGTKHFISQNEKLAPDRAWLGQLFDALASKDRDTMLKALEDVRNNFKEKG